MVRRSYAPAAPRPTTAPHDIPHTSYRKIPQAVHVPHARSCYATEHNRNCEDHHLKELRRRIQQIPIVSLLWNTVQEWQRDNIAQIAGSLAFFIMLSMAPLLVITVSVIGLVTDQHTIQGQVYDQLTQVIGENGATLVQNMVMSTNQSQAGGLAALISGVTLLYGAINVFGQLQEALNRIWGVEIKQEEGIVRTIKRRSLAATMLPLTGVMLLIVLLLDTVLSAVAGFFGDQVLNVEVITLLRGMNFLVSTLIITGMFAVIYKYLPDVQIAWEDVLTGAAFTAILFAVGQFLLSLYLTRSSVSSTYGAAGTFMVILLWLYYSAQIFLFGAEFTEVFARRRNRAIKPAHYARRLHPREKAEHTAQTTS